MADLKYLHSEAYKLRKKAHEKLVSAYKATTKALSFSKASDYQKATQEGELANHFFTEAIQLEHDAMDIDHHADELEMKANELDRQTIELQDTVRSKIEMIERLKKSIVGTYY